MLECIFYWVCGFAFVMVIADVLELLVDFTCYLFKELKKKITSK